MKKPDNLVILLVMLAVLNLKVQWERYLDGEENRVRFYGAMHLTTHPDGTTMSYCAVQAVSHAGIVEAFSDCCQSPSASFISFENNSYTQWVDFAPKHQIPVVISPNQPEPHWALKEGRWRLTWPEKKVE